jgi:uncharacterized protein (DUF433 family)
MEKFDNVIAALTTQHVAELTGLSIEQLAQWDRIGFFKPEHGEKNRRLPFSRIYSFRDVVGLRTIAILRKDYKIGLPKLKQVAARLELESPRPWSDLQLSVLKRDVAFLDRTTGQNVGATDGQIALLPLESVIEDMRRRAEALKRRPQEGYGKIERHKHVMQNRKVFAGTRIPVDVVANHLAAGHSTQQILREFPMLVKADVEAAKADITNKAA